MKKENQLTKNAISSILKDSNFDDSDKIKALETLNTKEKNNPVNQGLIQIAIDNLKIKIIKSKSNLICKNKKTNDIQKIEALEELKKRYSDKSPTSSPMQKVLANLEYVLVNLKIRSIVENEMFEQEERIDFLKSLQDNQVFEGELYDLIQKTINEIIPIELI